jgi:DNA topoisomerase-3
MSVLVIAEKPSVGVTIAAVLGAKDRKDGYLEGSGYIVSWCVGHLVRLADAEAYGDYQKWRREDLPILPDRWQTVIAADRQRQFDILYALMERPDVDSLVCATDAGREGELIFRLVYEKAGCKKPFARLWVSSMEEGAIRAAFDDLKDGHEYDSLYRSALCRAEADWLIGINATRLYSCLYGKTLSVGRVQSPTLAMLAERQDRIAGFVKERYHHVTIEAGGITARSGRIGKAEDAERVRASCDGQDAIVVSVAKEQKAASPPRLFDLTALQREANRMFGYTAKQTLDTAQTLYEGRLLTYPRTDSRFLASDMEAGLPALVKAAAALIGVGGVAVNAGAVTDDGKVSDHHAIIPTAALAKADITGLPETARNIALLVVARLVCATGERHVFEAVEVAVECGDSTFTAKGRTVITEGWKAADAAFRSTLGLTANDDGAEGGADSTALPDVAEGQTLGAATATATEHTTAPPKPYSEAALLSAMEAVGAAETTSKAERKGLGTPATRAAVIENLIARGFVTRKGRQLIPTGDGTTLIKILPDALKTPALTAEWEDTLALIAKGEADAEGFMRGIVGLATSIVREGAKDEALAALLSPDREVVGTCPRCGSNVHEGRKNFYCADRGCSFVMWKDDRFFEGKRKELTKAIATALLKDGKAQVKGLYSEKSHRTYDAVILLADTGGKYVNYRIAPREGKAAKG